MRQMAVSGTKNGCECNVANGSRDDRHASAIRVFMAGIQPENWLRARNAQYVEQGSKCGSDFGDTCDMERAVACKQPVREWCRCSQWRKLTALTQPKRPRGKGARGQGLAGCGVHVVNEPNDVWMLGAPMTDMPPVPPSAPMPALTMVHWMDDFDWTADGGTTPLRFAKGTCVAFLAAHLLHDFGDVRGLAVHQVHFGLAGWPFVHSFFTSFVGWSELLGGCFSVHARRCGTDSDV